MIDPQTAAGARQPSDEEKELAPIAGDLTRDAFLDGRVMLLQPRSGYRAGIDAVFLAAAAQPQERRSSLAILDAGAGVGAVGLLALRRLEERVDVSATLIERSPQLAALAERNAHDNGFASRARVVCADLLGRASALEAAGIHRESFDLVLSNPPYHVDAHGTLSENDVKAGAHAMGEGDLDRWARVLAHLTRPGGEVVIVHKAENLEHVLAAFSPRFGSLRIKPLHPRGGEPASRILVKGVKGSRAPLTLFPGMNLHLEGNEFHADAKLILRDGAGLWL